MSICIVDTSVFVEILNVPGKASQSKAILQELRNKIKSDVTLFLPMATILETGNHIAQNGDGNQRRKCAQRFVAKVQDAVDGKSPFTPLRFPEREMLQTWLGSFPDNAMRELGLGDCSIIADWEFLCRVNPTREVYIWSLDKHLSAYHTCGSPF